MTPEQFPALRNDLHIPEGPCRSSDAGSEDISPYKEAFLRYAREERDICPRDPSPMALKAGHTFRVLKNASLIAKTEHFPARALRAACLAALFHDLSRFEQYRLWGTFRDGESCDHGELSAWLLRESGMLKREPESGPILTAVALHNKISLPGGLDPVTQAVAFAVRDADRLDIMAVIDRHLSAKKDASADVVVPVPDSPDIFSQEVIDAVARRQCVHYGDIRSANDFRLTVAGWYHLMSYQASRILAARNGHVRHLAEVLPARYAPARDMLLTDLDTLEAGL